MAFHAGCRPAGAAFEFKALVAFDTMLFHDLLFDQFAFSFKSIDAALFLRKQSMTDITVLQGILMAMMGERDNPLAAAIDEQMLGPAIFHGQICPNVNARQGHYNSQHKQMQRRSAPYHSYPPYRMIKSYQTWPSSLHCEKSMSLPQSAHLWDLLNSSEKISFCAPQLVHVQINDFKLLKLSKPGQCCGVVISASFGFVQNKPDSCIRKIY
jgi:hypothetical protein